MKGLVGAMIFYPTGAGLRPVSSLLLLPQLELPSINNIIRTHFRVTIASM